MRNNPISEGYRRRLSGWVAGEVRRHGSASQFAAMLSVAAQRAVSPRTVLHWQSGQLSCTLNCKSLYAIALYRGVSVEKIDAWLTDGTPIPESDAPQYPYFAELMDDAIALQGLSEQQLRTALTRRQRADRVGRVSDREFEEIRTGKLPPQRDQVDFLRSIIDPTSQIEQIEWIRAWELDTGRCYFRKEGSPHEASEPSSEGKLCCSAGDKL